jgi:hypothetical protein
LELEELAQRQQLVWGTFLMERQPTPERKIAHILIDVGAIATIIIEECGASMQVAIIAADRILEYLEGIG